MFQGSSSISMDAKGRVNVPQKHRDTLLEQCGGALTLTKDPSGCLLLFPRPVWETHREKIASWPITARAWQRIYLGFATDVEIDASGRILVSPELREAANLNKEVMMLGMGSHFEIWDATLLKIAEDKAIAQGMPDVLNDFTF